MTKERLWFLIVFISVSSLALSCSAPRTTTIPEIKYTPLKQVHNTQPDCSDVIQKSLDEGGDCLDAFWCYDRVIQHWENAYEILVEQVKAQGE